MRFVKVLVVILVAAVLLLADESAADQLNVRPRGRILAAATASGLSAQLVAGFVDAELDQLLRIDGSREATACLVPLGGGTVFTQFI